MTEFADEMIVVATELISEEGTNFQYVHNDITPSADEMEIDTGAVEQTIIGVRVNDLETLGFRGDAVNATDFGMIMFPQGFVPKTADQIIVDGKKRGVANVSTIKPGDTAILYLLQMR